MEYALSIAGFDPSGGAGLLADIKTFEALGVYGLGVCSALTVQTDKEFLSVTWQTADQIIAQLKPLLERFPISYCKIGIVQDVHTLTAIITLLRAYDVRIVLDPVLKASAGYTFHTAPAWGNALKDIYLLTPNYEEALLLGEVPCAMLLKGGHRPDKRGWDTLHLDGATHEIPPQTIGEISPKHGSGCVLSAAITARLAHGDTLLQACTAGKKYTERFLSSHSSLLGFHYT
jgi:hydroxymethylpyrimidine/phosphomethylpyrimidine kinase